MGVMYIRDENGKPIPIPGGSGGGGKYPDWSRFTWYVVGDSLTERTYAHTAKYYYEFIQEKTGIKIIVDGAGGTGYKAGVNTDGGITFLDRMKKNLKEEDEAGALNVDIVTIFGSGNDIEHTENLAYDEKFTTLSWLANHRPGLRVIVAPPVTWMGYDKRKSANWLSYCNRLKECALACDFRYLSDLYDCPPFNPNFAGHLKKFFGNRPDGKEADGIHPSTNGHKALAQYFYNALLQELAPKSAGGDVGTGTGGGATGPKT